MNYYQTLGIPQNASKVQIMRAYLGFVDAFKVGRVGSAQFSAIEMAYGFLSQEKSRRVYDANLRDEIAAREAFVLQGNVDRILLPRITVIKIEI